MPLTASGAFAQLVWTTRGAAHYPRSMGGWRMGEHDATFQRLAGRYAEHLGAAFDELAGVGGAC